MNATLVEKAVDAVIAKYEIISASGIGGYIITRDGAPLRRGGVTRIFTTRNSARKRIHRERTGNFHK